MPQTFKIGDRVQNVRSTSEYYGQTGTILEIQTPEDGTRYVVSWSSGELHVYRAASLTMAQVPEKSFLVSDSGFRKNDNGSRKVTKHRVPPSQRPALI